MRRLLIFLAALAAGAASHAQPLAVGDFGRGTPGELPFGWTPQLLGDLPPTAYALVNDEGRVVLRATADASVSGLKRRLRLDPAARPYLAWRWKVDGVVPSGRMDQKSGDDYAARLYVTFDYDPADLSFRDRMTYRALTALGYDVPLRALCYVWANRPEDTALVPNPYTGWVQMVPVQSGPARAGQWVDEKRDLVADYQAAFGERPPAITGIVLMTDTDNTGTAVSASYGDIHFRD